MQMHEDDLFRLALAPSCHPSSGTGGAAAATVVAAAAVAKGPDERAEKKGARLDSTGLLYISRQFHTPPVSQP